jgi:hypothetical protein
MAIFGKFWDGYLTINAVDLSDRVKSMVLEQGNEVLDHTAMGNATKVNAAGIKNWQITVEFLDDLAASQVEVTLQALVGAAAFAVAFRADGTSAISATNPEYQGNAVLGAPLPLGGAHGQSLMKSVTLVSAGDLTRDITP